jgi:hypothetical protein
MDPLMDLAERAWGLFAAARGQRLEHVVSPSMPILYFGELPRYLASQVRVVSVGLNPSRLEFPTTNPWQRFPGGESLDDGHGDCRSIDAYLSLLDPYFTIDPYTGWFRPSFETLLEGLEASL